MEEENTEGRTQVYELGYHITPSLQESDLPQEVSGLKSLIEEHKGIVISEELPKKRPLAYAISKVEGGVKHLWSESYFGWVKFEVSPEEIVAVEEGVKKNLHILRYLLIKTVKENTLYGLKIAQSAKMQGGIERREKSPAVRPKDAPKMSPEEMDKTIEELIKE
ncbi:MAG: 30S ribosomal protein S6 [Candidatus Taylorbacteria bacterium]